jgi:hypothetical protein
VFSAHVACRTLICRAGGAVPVRQRRHQLDCAVVRAAAIRLTARALLCWLLARTNCP